MLVGSFRKYFAISLLTTQLLSVSAMAGNGGTLDGGGGDAIMVNGQMVPRDFVLEKDIKLIKDNAAFFKKIPGFEELIKELMKVHPIFGSEVLTDLMAVRIYSSEKELPILPYSETTIIGQEADFQLAIRRGYDLVVGPGLQDYPLSAYVMLHEALHGLLSENEGPFHHQRVRTIVKYIYDNRSHLEYKELDELLNKNNYYHRWSDDAETRQKQTFAFERSNDPHLRCYYAVTTGAIGITLYDKLNCLENNPNRVMRKNLDILQFLSEKFSDLSQEYETSEWKSFDPFDLESDLPRIPEANVVKPSLFNKKLAKEQEAVCSSIGDKIKKLIEVEKRIEETISFGKKIIVVLQSPAYGKKEKEIVSNVFSPLKLQIRYAISIQDNIKFYGQIEEVKKTVDQSLLQAEKLKKECQQYYK